MVYPTHWNDLVGLFGRSGSALSRIHNYMLDLFVNKYQHLLVFNVQRFVDKLPEWAAAVSRICPNTYTTVTLFLDGTHRKTCRPKPAASSLPIGITQSDVQRSQYDGHKKKHGLKYQALVAPNGIIVHAYGPVDGRRHDTTVLRQSGLGAAQHQLSVNGVDYCIYADSAYARTRNMQKPFRNPPVASPQAQVNTVMARARTTASECAFSYVSNMWQAVDFVRQQKIFWTRPADTYYLAILLSNIRTCLRRYNIASEFFNLSDTCPTLSDYLQGNWNN